MPADFSKAKIYKITNDYNDDIYVGCTCDELNKRFSKHKGDSKNEQRKNRSIYVLMNDIGFDRFRIQLIENYPCEDMYQLRQREGYWIRQIGTLNHRIENRTHTEYMNEYNKQYYEKNRVYFQDKYKENIEKIRIRQEDNKELKQQYDKEYREKNKDKIHEHDKERKSTKIVCECGCTVRNGFYARHKKTKKHIELMKTI
jgi:group I intron endonuclease